MSSVHYSSIIHTRVLCFRLLSHLKYIYVRLRDESVVVRYNTLMVITHLVLNDMIKVKGNVNVMHFGVDVCRYICTIVLLD